jgi:hypothetical protein
MKGKFLFRLNPEELVEYLRDTGVTEWDGSYIARMNHRQGAYLGDERGKVVFQINRGMRSTLHDVAFADLLRVFNKFTHKMSFTVTDGELEDLDLDADLADEIIQTAIFGEVVYA